MKNKKYPWGWGNEVLYRMCREEPRHSNEDIIAGKLWLIGRAYSAAIERQAGDNLVKGENFYATKVAPIIKASKIDQWIESVRSIERVTIENYDQILSAHKKLTDLLKKITGKEKRSLASKYLHFHAPNAFFIYDSKANTKLRAYLNSKRYKYPVGYDNSYASYAVRCIDYRDRFLEKQIDRQATPRELDQWLMGY